MEEVTPGIKKSMSVIAFPTSKFGVPVATKLAKL